MNIFKTRNIPMTSPENKSAGILDDYAVRKDVATLGGTIEKYPVNNNDIVPKIYVDNLSGINLLQHSTFLQLSGGNANQNINIGNYYLSGAGLIARGTISGGAFAIGSRYLDSTGWIVLYNLLDADGSGIINSGDSLLWNARILNWNTAYGWGDHSIAGYIKSGNTLSGGNVIANLISGSSIYTPGTISGSNIKATSTLAVSGTNLIVNSAGNVGIGTASPGSILDIFAASARPRIKSTTTSGWADTSIGLLAGNGGVVDSNADVLLNLVSNNGVPDSASFGTKPDIPFYILTNNTVQMTILGNGNVGIGTSAPETKLHVSGTIQVDTYGVVFQCKNPDYGATVVDGLALDASGTLFFGYENPKIVLRANTSSVAAITDGLFVVAGNISGSSVKTDNAMINISGALCVNMTAGENLSGGHIVRAMPASDGRVVKTGLADGFLKGNDMPIGIAVHEAVSGSSVWVAVSGKTKVYIEPGVNISGGYFMKTSPNISGAAAGGENPAVPADANHWREIGHAVESLFGGNGLVNVMLHFN